MNYLGDNPIYPLFFFFIIPMAALIANFTAKGEGHLSPWCIYYSVLIYLSVIPGIFAILLVLNNVLFERNSVYNIDVLTIVLPILSMILTLYLIKRNVNFSEIPGFGKITSFLSIIAMLMFTFYLLDKTHMILFSYLPFQWILVILVVIFLIIRFGTKKLFS